MAKLRVQLLGGFQEGSAVRFNPQSDYSLDVKEFEEKLEAACGSKSRSALIGHRDVSLNNALAALASRLWLEGWLQSEASHVLPTLYRQTEGPPLFLTELARALVLSSTLFRDQTGHWKLAIEEISLTDWPEDLRELVRASLRRVPARAHSLLGPAAVIGREFELPVLREVLHQPEEKVVYEGLSTDRKKALAQKSRPSAGDGSLWTTRRTLDGAGAPF